MPLIQGKSEKTLGKNIGKEIGAGKDPKQAAAIAYSVQRKNKDAVIPKATPEQLAALCDLLDKISDCC
jgi:hypothetical protein